MYKGLLKQTNAALLWAVAVFLMPAGVFAGQSLVLKTGFPSFQIADAPLSDSRSWRLELQVHDFTAAPAGNYGEKFFWLSGTGVIASLYPDGSINISDLWDLGNGGAPCSVSTTGLKNILVRAQRDVTHRIFTCEVWSYDGTGYANQTLPFGASRNYDPGTGGGDVGLGVNASLGFLRVATTIVPLGSKPPTTADAGDWMELKFDGDLRDSSGKGHSLSGSAPIFMPTPNQTAVALPKTFGAPAWSNWVSLRAGFPAQLDGSASYSLADSSSAVTPFWQEISGPTTVTWDDRASLTPTVKGLIFGQYTFSLRVTDAAGSVSTATQIAGAVATDSNGVVVNADPNVDKIFGPMIAFGKNPWGYADQRAMTATSLRYAAYQNLGLMSPSWETPQPGTVSYYFNGANGLTATTLSADISATATSIKVADAKKLDLTNLPTRILIGPFYGRREEIRVCAASATSGPATLTVCYDGRGQANPQGESYRAGSQAWPAGTWLFQMRVTGAGTNFFDQLCQGGAGPAGRFLYGSGTATISAGSAAVSGSGVVWNNANGIYPNSTVFRVSATHGGAPFVFYAYVTALADSSHMTLSRPFPADADSGSYNYAILQADSRYVTLHYARTGTDNSDAQAAAYMSGCESPTDLYTYSFHDLLSVTAGLQSGKQFAYMDNGGYVGAYGVNFYGEDLAHRALYYRSGWSTALNAARVMGDRFVRFPEVAGGDVGGIPLLLGGGVIGGFAAAVLDGNHPGAVSWSDLRAFARTGSVGTASCYFADTRDSSYLSSWLALAAAFDPDPAQNARWQTALAAIYARELACKGSDNSWANGANFYQGFGPMSVTSGSATVTGTNLPASMCNAIAQGTVNVVNGSAALAADSGAFVPGVKIVINGTLNGQPYTSHFAFSVNSATTATMGALWPGDSGTFSFMIANSDATLAIATSNSDVMLRENWVCASVSPTQITLNRPWDGPTEGNVYASAFLVAGFGQQPYMMGIKNTQLRFASLTPNPTLAAQFATLAGQAGTWVHDVGYDSYLHGLSYGRVYAACEPPGVVPPGISLEWRSPGCTNAAGGIKAARTLTAEAFNALTNYYTANPGPAAKTWGDTAYGSVFGNPAYTTGGVYSDSNFVVDEDGDNSLGAYKWTGFFFGMGMAHQWPAVRLGGVAPARPRTVYIGLNRGTADAAQIKVTAPSGAITTFRCGADPSCAVQVDDRQGTHWVQIGYFTAGVMTAQSLPDLLPAFGN